MSIPLGFGSIFSGWVTPLLNNIFYFFRNFCKGKKLYLESRKLLTDLVRLFISANLGLTVNSNHWIFHCLSILRGVG